MFEKQGKTNRIIYILHKDQLTLLLTNTVLKSKSAV